MLTPIPRRILRDSAVFHVPTGVDRYQTPTTEDVAIECVHIQADNSIRKTPNNTEVTLRATLFVDARYSKPHVDLWGLQEAAQAAGGVMTCTVTTKYNAVLGPLTVAVVEPLPDDEGNLHHYEIGLY